MLLLPTNAQFEPAPPIRPARPEDCLDLVILIDATTRHFFQPEKGAATSVPLLARQEAWQDHAESLCLLAAALLPPGLDGRVTLLAFGDQRPPRVDAQDLCPAYHLLPDQEEQRRFEAFAEDRLRARLLALRPSSGGDFVDALADALDACARLRWRPETRKLLVLSGDSPGHSLLHPLPKGADASLRDRDVDTQALRLHRLGVEIATIYHAPAAELGLADISFQRDLLEGARVQYARLASLPEMAFEAAAFDAASAARAIRERAIPVGRDAVLGELLAVTAGVEAGLTGAEPAPAAAAGGTSSRRSAS